MGQMAVYFILWVLEVDPLCSYMLMGCWCQLISGATFAKSSVHVGAAVLIGFTGGRMEERDNDNIGMKC